MRILVSQTGFAAAMPIAPSEQCRPTSRELTRQTPNSVAAVFVDQAVDYRKHREQSIRNIALLLG